MRSVRLPGLRPGNVLLVILAVIILNIGFARPSAAQFGIGARLAFIKTEDPGVTEDSDFVRYFGGQIRIRGSRVGLEVSLDRHAEDIEALGQRFIEYPLQTSLILYLARGGFAPYLIGGPGWYKHKVEPIDDDSPIESVSTTDFGWHAGFGAEIKAGRHFGVHGDYRYTFLDFGGDDDDDGGILGGVVGGLLPSHKGSMWTIGATVYF
jgi:hypothetical protein